MLVRVDNPPRMHVFNPNTATLFTQVNTHTHTQEEGREREGRGGKGEWDIHH